MPDPWNFAGESAALGSLGSTITLVQGSAFCISGAGGDIAAGTPQGLYFRDTRLVSSLVVLVNGERPEVLAGTATDPFAAAFVARRGPLLVLRHRYIGRGMREDLRVRNFGDEAAFCAIEVRIDVDFADLFDVKEGRTGGDGERSCDGSGTNDATHRIRRGGVRRGVRFTFPEDTRFELVIPPHGEWSTCLQVTPIIEDDEIQPRYLCGQPVERATPAERLEKWRRDVPVVTTDDNGLRLAVERSVDDLGALRIFDPDFP